ncbi:MAG: MBL fold metallo-hydrolase [bacterium]|nr:MBL fold metallo-hydrolase [bacterium]
MKVTKLGHCALVLETDGVKILTDPGSYTVEAQNAQTGIDIVLITHEHQDHYHVDSLKKILKNNPQAVVVTNAAVAVLISQEDMRVTVNIVGDGQSISANGVLIEGFGKEHALVYPPNMGLVENTGYFVANKFYFPGDNFHNPGKKVDILALPAWGPWMKMSQAVDFAKEIKARTGFAVHDGMLIPEFRGFIHQALKMFAPETEFVELKDGETREF